VNYFKTLLSHMLRDYQQKIKSLLFSEWELYPCILVQIPTGTGNTHLLASLVNEELYFSRSQTHHILKSEKSKHLILGLVTSKRPKLTYCPFR